MPKSKKPEIKPKSKVPAALEHFERGNGFAKEKDWDKAIEEFTEAIRLDPKFAASYKNRDKAIEEKQWNKTKAEFSEAIRLGPNVAASSSKSAVASAQEHFDRGNKFIKKKDWDNAIAEFTEAIKLDPYFAASYYNRGKVHNANGSYGKAIFDYTRAIDLTFPTCMSAYDGRRDAYEKKGNPNKALDDFASAWSFGSEMSTTRIALVSRSNCTACGACVSRCPGGAIAENPPLPVKIDPMRCDGCSACEAVCPTKAIYTLTVSNCPACEQPIQFGQKTCQCGKQFGPIWQTAEALYQDPLLEIGLGLAPQIGMAQEGSTLLGRISAMRLRIAQESGVAVPQIRMRDNPKLPANSYRLLISEKEVGRGEVALGQYLAMNPGAATEPLDGEATKEPMFGLPSFWIEEGMKDRAQAFGYVVVDWATVTTTHVAELLIENMPELRKYKLLGDAVAQSRLKLLQEQNERN